MAALPALFRGREARTVSDIIVDTLLDWGVDTIFGLPGDGINGVFEALRQHIDWHGPPPGCAGVNDALRRSPLTLDRRPSATGARTPEPRPVGAAPRFLPGADNATDVALSPSEFRGHLAPMLPAVQAARPPRAEQIRFIQTRHEEAAAFMAAAHAKYTGKLGVCIATSGPGAIHLLN